MVAGARSMASEAPLSLSEEHPIYGQLCERFYIDIGKCDVCGITLGRLKPQVEETPCERDLVV